jgi:hypothetical protein
VARWRRDVAALAGCAVLWWFGMRGTRVPLLGAADLGFHELGHAICYVLDAALPWPEVVTAAAGSAFQIGVPLALAAYFFSSRRGDHVAGALCLAWAGTAAADVARYVRDAPTELLPLIGGKHDWATILGPEHLDRLDEAAAWAAAFDRLAWVLFLVAVLVPLWSLLTYRQRRDAARLHLLRDRPS